MAIQHVKIAVTVAGADGAAAGSTTTGTAIRGYFLGAYVTYTSQPNTTDVTVATPGNTHPAVTLLTLTNANTNGWKYSRAQVHDTAGAALTLDGTRANVEKIPITDQITVTVAQGNAGSVVVVVLWDDGRSK